MATEFLTPRVKEEELLAVGLCLQFIGMKLMLQVSSVPLKPLLLERA